MHSLCMIEKLCPIIGKFPGKFYYSGRRKLYMISKSLVTCSRSWQRNPWWSSCCLYHYIWMLKRPNVLPILAGGDLMSLASWKRVVTTVTSSRMSLSTSRTSWAILSLICPENLVEMMKINKVQIYWPFTYKNVDHFHQ